MAKKTYEVWGVGNFGVAHPLHNPSCDLKLYVDGEHFATQRLSGGYEAHYEGLRRGFEPAREDMKQSNGYKFAALDLGVITI